MASSIVAFLLRGAMIILSSSIWQWKVFEFNILITLLCPAALDLARHEQLRQSVERKRIYFIV